MSRGCPLGACLRIKHSQNRFPQFGAQQFITLIQRGAEKWLGFIEGAAHIHGLRALASEEKGNDGGFGAVGYLSSGQIEISRRQQILAQQGLELGGRGRRHTQPMGKMAAANLAGIREIGQLKCRVGGEKIQIALGIGG